MNKSTQKIFEIKIFRYLYDQIKITILNLSTINLRKKYNGFTFTIIRFQSNERH